MYQVKLYENYISNVDNILRLVEKENDRFFVRSENEKYNFHTQYGDSKLKSHFLWNMTEDLKEEILNGLNNEDKTAHGITINRYDPGDFLLRHRDSQGSYYKFKLIFLRSDKPHFKWYDESGIGHLIDEKPGSYLEMPIHLEHEVTKIEQDERPKYSLVLSWGL
jgi:hypothetical protein